MFSSQALFASGSITGSIDHLREECADRDLAPVTVADDDDDDDNDDDDGR